MTDDDDTWGELARELEIDKPAASELPPDPADPVAEEAGEFEDAGVVEAEPGAAEGDDAEGEGGEPGDGQPGTGRKRRRRRRRRKKGGPADAPGAEAGEVGGESEAGDAEEAEAEAEPAAPAVSRHEADDDEAEEIEPAGVPLAAEEDTGSEVLRELIATWNVPSWDDIVAGLYRPER